MPSVADFSFSLDKNNRRTFSEGDTVRGTVCLVLRKSIKVLSLSVKATGDADVEWVDEETSYDEHTHTYSQHRRLFKQKQFIVSARLKGSALLPGPHWLPFSVRIPSTKHLPSSFSGAHGSVRYQLEAKLCRRNRKARRVQQAFEFHSKSVPASALMSPRTASSRAAVGTYRTGFAELEVRLERNAFAPGEKVKIVAKISNSSNHIVRAYFLLRNDTSYTAEGRTTSTSAEFKSDEGAIVRPHTEQEQVILKVIPERAQLTLHDCPGIKTQYSLEGALKVLHSHDGPRVCLPLVVIARDVPSTVCFSRSEAS